MRKNKNGLLNRRKFSAISALGLASALFPFKPVRAQLRIPAIGAEEKVFLTALKKSATDIQIADAVREVALATTNFSWLSKGDTVLIKPACNSNHPYPATTHPASITAMAKLLKEKGAGRVIVMDMGGVASIKLSPDKLRGSTRQLMKENGILAGAEAGGAELYFPEEDGWNAFFEDGPASGSHWKNGIMLPKKLKEVDHIVLMPRTSRHTILGTTLGLKAVVGYMRYDSRLEYHRDASTIYEKTAEANTVPSLKNKLRLVITTATKVLTTLGPDQGYITEPETALVFASTSIVAHDMLSLAWFLHNRSLTPENEKSFYKDPYLSLSPTLNRGVVLLLGGVREAAKTESMKTYDFQTIWEEPCLNRAFHIFGGVPKVSLNDLSGKIPHQLKNNLAQKISL